MKYRGIKEEELKIKVGEDYFGKFDATRKVGNIDFWIEPSKETAKEQIPLFEDQSLLWAEAKTGDYDVYSMFSQLILTIGKERTFDKFLPPAFLGVFDSAKIVFIPYNTIIDIFSINDFNWNVTPSNHNTKEFHIIKRHVEQSLANDQYVYNFIEDSKELQFFIKNNVGKSTESGKILIDKNNFVPIYLRWIDQIKPFIDFNWEDGQKQGIFDSDFYLADLFINDHDTNTILDDTPVAEHLFVIFRNSRYEISKDDLKTLFNAHIELKDSQPYIQFWKKYKRPPTEEYQEYILNRRDLLVPQDLRERKGAFFTPQIWVELSQNYLTRVFGENWQEEYFIWDCAAGTGNLLAGLTNKYNIWASTLDQADVNVMQERINNGAELLESHVFQFDFLNDSLEDLPPSLKTVIEDPDKLKKLIIYINPPYAEHGSRKTITESGSHKTSVAKTSKIYKSFQTRLGSATRELFIQFFLRAYSDLPSAKLASFSTVKFINSQNFAKFRHFFRSQFLGGFMCNASTFDNVKGKFPIGFLIWNMDATSEFTKNIHTDIINADYFESENIVEKKTYRVHDRNDYISSWLRQYYDKTGDPIGYLILPGVDMQQQSGVYFTLQPTESDIKQHKTTPISISNIREMTIYLAVRQCIPINWINNKDQFLRPNPDWIDDREFQNDCLIYSVFHGQNKISLTDGLNHWIPFSESQVDAKGRFDSNLLYKYIMGTLESTNITVTDLFQSVEPVSQPLTFSIKAIKVLDAGLNLWKYYHAQDGVDVNASYYDIREYFQGRNSKGRMNSSSNDELYNRLLGELKQEMKTLSKKLEQFVYAYEFIKQ